MNQKVAIIIPCYNEEKTIGNVINSFRQELPMSEIYVGDNNSSDKTAKVAKDNGAKVVFESQQGKANVVQEMFRVIDADIYIMIDGDDTYPANAINGMLEQFISNDIDMLVGDRLSNGTYKTENKRSGHSFGNKLMCMLINNLFRSELNDVLSGYRIFSRRYVKNYIAMSKGFELEVDLTTFALNYGLKIEECSICYKDRQEDSLSKLSTYKDGRGIINTIFKLYRFYRPLAFFTWLGIFIFIVSIILGFLPIYEFVKYSYVYKVPTAILAGFLAIAALLLLICGLILDTIMKIDRKNIMLQIRNTE